MRKLTAAIVFTLLFSVISSSIYGLTVKEIDKYLRNYTEKGYKFLKSVPNSDTWYVSFKLPEWEAEWSICVILLKSEDGTEVVTIGTTVATTENEPTNGLMKYLLEANGADINIGSFSIYYDKHYSIQYFVRIPNEYCKLDQLIHAIGWVAGYCNGLEPEISKFLE